MSDLTDLESWDHLGLRAMEKTDVLRFWMAEHQYLTPAQQERFLAKPETEQLSKLSLWRLKGVVEKHRRLKAMVEDLAFLYPAKKRTAAEIRSLAGELLQGGGGAANRGNDEKTNPTTAEELLKLWRKLRMREENIPTAFQILHNTTLQEIASKKPTSASELLAIKGIGRLRLERFGSDIFAVLKLNDIEELDHYMSTRKLPLTATNVRNTVESPYKSENAKDAEDAPLPQLNRRHLDLRDREFDPEDYALEGTTTEIYRGEGGYWDDDDEIEPWD